MLKQSHSTDIPKTLRGLVDNLITLYNQGELDQALQQGNEIIKRFPASATVQNVLGAVNYRLSNKEQAVHHLRETIKLNPNNSSAFNNLGAVLNDLGHLSEAKKLLKRAIRIKPKFAEAYNNLGNTFLKLADYDKAIEQYTKSIELNPQQPQAFNNLGTAFHKIGKNIQAIKTFKKAIHLNREFSEAYTNVGKVLYEQRHYQEAIPYLQKALKGNSNHIESLLYLAKVLFNKGDYNEALTNFEKVLACDPNCNEAAYYSSIILFDIGESKLAFELIRQGLAKDPNDKNLIRIYSEGLASTGDIKASIDWHQKLLQLSPKNSAVLADLIQFSWFDPKLKISNLFNRFCELENKAQNIPKNYSKRAQDMVALMCYGRSGSLFLHSLVDGHPELSTLPGYYFKGWFSQETWDKLAPQTNNLNWKEDLAENICDYFEPQFNAYSRKNVIGAPDGHTHWFANSLGFTKMGPSQSTVLKLDEVEFKKRFLEILKLYESIDQRSCFEAIHEAFDSAYRRKQKDDMPGNKTIFYHIHNPNNFEHTNFLRHYPKAKTLYIVRNPIQMIESWVQPFYDELIESSETFQKKIRYHKITNRISCSFKTFYNPLNALAETKGIKLEDIKKAPKATLRSIAEWMKIEDHHSLYKSQFLNYDYSRPSASFDMITGFDAQSINASLGRFFGERDIQILETLLWPMLVTYNYTETTKPEFTKKLKDIRSWLDKPFQFEEKIFEKIPPEESHLEKSETFQIFHRHLINLWKTLDDTGTYPYIFQPLYLNKRK